MQPLSLLALAALFRSGLAFPSGSSRSLQSNTRGLQCQQYEHWTSSRGGPEPDGHEWIPAHCVSGAVRSPCPFLNTAANHGFLPRDGLQISIAQFDNAIEEALGFSPEFAHTVTTGMLGKLGVLKNIFSDALLRIDLNATNAHNKTEHDASLSRLDANQGDAAVVRPNLVQEMLDDTVPESFNCLNTSSIGWTRARRQRESVKAGNPPLSDAFVVAGQGEAALMLLIMGDGDAVTPENGDARCAPKERVQTFFDQERFPYELGFKVPARIVQADEVVPLSGGIAKYEVLEQNSDRSQSLR